MKTISTYSKSKVVDFNFDFLFFFLFIYLFVVELCFSFEVVRKKEAKNSTVSGIAKISAIISLLLLMYF